MDEDRKLDHLKDDFTQFEADNVDHNTDIQDRKGTLHEIGITAFQSLIRIYLKKSVTNTNNFKIETIERKDSIKLNWYQQKDVRSFLTGTTCKKIHCYMRDSACRWFIVKKAKIF